MAKNKGNPDTGQSGDNTAQKLSPWLEKRLLREAMTLTSQDLSTRVSSHVSSTSGHLPIGENGSRLTQEVVSRPRLVTRTPENLPLSSPANLENTGRYSPSTGWSELELLVSSHDTDRGITGKSVVPPTYSGKGRNLDVKNIRPSPPPQITRRHTATNTPSRPTVNIPPSGSARIVRGKIEETPTSPPGPTTEISIPNNNKPDSPQSNTTPVISDTVSIEKPGQDIARREEQLASKEKTRPSSDITKENENTDVKLSPAQNGIRSPAVVDNTTRLHDLPIQEISRSSVSEERNSQKTSPVEPLSTVSKKNDQLKRKPTSEHKKVESAKQASEIETTPSVSSIPKSAPIGEEYNPAVPTQTIHAQPETIPDSRTNTGNKTIVPKSGGDTKPRTKVVSRKSTTPVDTMPTSEKNPGTVQKTQGQSSKVPRQSSTIATPATPKPHGPRATTRRSSRTYADVIIPESPIPDSQGIVEEQRNFDTLRLNKAVDTGPQSKGISDIQTPSTSLHQVISRSSDLTEQANSNPEQLSPDITTQKTIGNGAPQRPSVGVTDSKNNAGVSEEKTNLPPTTAINAVTEPTRIETKGNIPPSEDIPRTVSVIQNNMVGKSSLDLDIAINRQVVKPELTEPPIQEAEEDSSYTQSESSLQPISENLPASGTVSKLTSSELFSPIKLPVQRKVRPVSSVTDNQIKKDTHRLPSTGTPATLDLPVVKAARPRVIEGAIRSESVFRQTPPIPLPTRAPQSPPVEVHTLPGFASVSTQVSRAPGDTQTTSTTTATTTTAAETGQQSETAATPNLKALARDIYPYIRRMLIIEKERLPRV